MEQQGDSTTNIIKKTNEDTSQLLYNGKYRYNSILCILKDISDGKYDIELTKENINGVPKMFISNCNFFDKDVKKVSILKDYLNKYGEIESSVSFEFKDGKNITVYSSGYISVPKGGLWKGYISIDKSKDEELMLSVNKFFAKASPNKYYKMSDKEIEEYIKNNNLTDENNIKNIKQNKKDMYQTIYVDELSAKPSGEKQDKQDITNNRKFFKVHSKIKTAKQQLAIKKYYDYNYNYNKEKGCWEVDKKNDPSSKRDFYFYSFQRRLSDFGITDKIRSVEPSHQYTRSVSCVSFSNTDNKMLSGIYDAIYKGMAIGANFGRMEPQNENDKDNQIITHDGFGYNSYGNVYNRRRAKMYGGYKKTIFGMYKADINEHVQLALESHISPTRYILANRFTKEDSPTKKKFLATDCHDESIVVPSSIKTVPMVMDANEKEYERGSGKLQYDIHDFCIVFDESISDNEEMRNTINEVVKLNAERGVKNINLIYKNPIEQTHKRYIVDNDFKSVYTFIQNLKLEKISENIKKNCENVLKYATEFQKKNRYFCLFSENAITVNGVYPIVAEFSGAMLHNSKWNNDCINKITILKNYKNKYNKIISSMKIECDNNVYTIYSDGYISFPGVKKQIKISEEAQKAFNEMLEKLPYTKHKQVVNQPKESDKTQDLKNLDNKGNNIPKGKFG